MPQFFQHTHGGLWGKAKSNCTGKELLQLYICDCRIYMYLKILATTLGKVLHIESERTNQQSLQVCVTLSSRNIG